MQRHREVEDDVDVAPSENYSPPLAFPLSERNKNLCRDSDFLIVLRLYVSTFGALGLEK